MLDKLRNIGIIAHVDAGKTTTTERLLYYSGTKHELGSVDGGDTTTDSDILEQEKGITINSAAVSIDWGKNKINIIDTPGHVDFTAEVERSLRVLDGAVGVFCAVGGVEVQSETVWFQSNKYKVPRIAYINKLDRLGADFQKCVSQMVEKLHVVPAICAIPVGQSKAFKGIIDLIENKFVLKDDTDKTERRYSLVEIPESHKVEAASFRTALLEMASLADDSLAEKLVNGQDVTKPELLNAIRKGTIEGKFTPIYCGSSKTSHGVQILLDAVVNFLPSPIDRPPVEGTHPKTKEKSLRKPDVAEPFSGLAFKTVSEQTGDLVYVRIYSGVLKQADTLLNTTTGKTERIARIYRMMGDKRIKLQKAEAGDIVAVVGLSNTYTGNTLCDQDSPVTLESINFPKPVVSSALSIANSLDAGKLGEALGKMTRDDPTVKVHTDEETKDLILSGMGELHLEITVEKIRRTIGLPQGDPALALGKPRVAYRQTLAHPIEFVTKYGRQSGGHGKFAVIHVRYTPLDQVGIEKWVARMVEEGKKPDVNNVYFDEEIYGGSVPKEYIGPVEEGIRNMAKKGSKYPFPFVDLECVLFDGKIHPVDSSADAFRLAAEQNFRDVQKEVGIKLLEPIMTVVVVSPEQYQGSITGDIARRRGLIEEISSDKGRGSIRAKVPLANLFGYTNDLRGATSGTASFSMEFSHYAQVSEALADLPKLEQK